MKESHVLSRKAVIAGAIGLLVLAGLAAAAEPLRGKIVFSTQPIDLAGPKNLTTAFKSGDFIYAAALMDDKWYKLFDYSSPRGKDYIEVRMTVDGVMDFANVMLRNEAMDRTTLAIDIAPEPGRMTAYTDPNIVYDDSFSQHTKGGPMQFTTILSKLPGGAHTVRFSAYRYKDLAVGEFTIEGNTFQNYESLQTRLAGAETQNVFMPKPGMRDGRLEEAMGYLLGKSSFEGFRGQILRVVIQDKDWSLQRHELTGAVMFRYIRAAVAVKGKDGKCRLITLVNFKQEFVGNEFQKLQLDGWGQTPIEIPCENVGR
jgi:hypothetical protein